MNDRAPSRRWVARFAIAALVTGALVGATSGPAGAGACSVPAAPAADGRIRVLPAGPLLGNAVYNVSGEGQAALESLVPGEKANFEVTYRNASTKTRTITVSYLTFVGDHQSFVIKFFRGDKDITETLGDGKQFKSRPPGSTTPPVRVQVRMKGSASALHAVLINLRGAYGKTFPSCGDHVQAEAGNLI
jgi:hypothetical protein